MINYKKTYTESTSWRHWRLSCYFLPPSRLFTAYSTFPCVKKEKQINFIYIYLAPDSKELVWERFGNQWIK